MTIWMPVEPEANELLTRSPLALLIAMLLDQQVSLERAFSAPLDLVRGSGTSPPPPNWPSSTRTRWRSYFPSGPPCTATRGRWPPGSRTSPG